MNALVSLSKSVGSFFGGITNNPGTVAILLGIGALFLFRNDIRGAFGSVGESIRGIGSGDVNVNIPNPLEGFNLPSINLGNLNPFGQNQSETIQLLDTPGNPANNPQFSTPIDVALANDLPLPQPTPGEIASDPNRDPTRFNPPGVTCFGCPDSPEGIPIEQFPSVLEEPTLQLPSEFQGGGPSFIGGSINETPINFDSLSDIIDRFGVTASQAANIQATAQDNFGNFDFGSNTGSGIGSVITQPDIASELPGGNVSDPQFIGLTPTEIMQRILGGNINNF